MTEPTGVSIHDPETDELRADTRWAVIHGGAIRQLNLRVARGFLTRHDCAIDATWWEWEEDLGWDLRAWNPARSEEEARLLADGVATATGRVRKMRAEVEEMDG